MISSVSRRIRLALFALYIAAMLFIPGMEARAEYVFLTNGAIIKGTVLNQTAAKTVFKTEAGAVVTYEASSILRVLYTDLYMGQQYIRLTDGKVVQAYLVDEDQTTYTFRKDIGKPEEFTIPRQKVLFMARKNPNELEGTADFTSLTLKWKAPLGSVKGYRVYVKKESESYAKQPSGETGSLQYKVTGLASSTDYTAIVTAVDEKGQESLPSNEITIGTLNMEPSAPEGLRCVMVNEWQDKKLKALLEWTPSIDSDGLIGEYEVHLKLEGKKDFTLAGKAAVDPKKTKEDKFRYEITGLEKDREYSIMVRAADNRKTPSPFSQSIKFTTRNTPPFPVLEVLGRKGKYTGGPGIDVTISWGAVEDPDGIVKIYRIYEKTGKEYRPIATSQTNEYILKGIAIDRTYTFEVRAVDNRGQESEKNKSFNVPTTNEPPDPPAKVEKIKTVSPDNKTFSITLSWPPAEDIDGVTAKYRIYIKTGGEEKIHGETGKTTYTVAGLDASRDYSFDVRTVDNRGMESGAKAVARPVAGSAPAKEKPKEQAKEKPKPAAKKTAARSGKSIGLNLTGRYAFLLPMRDFAEMYGMGHGGMISLRYDRLGIDGITLGLDLGFYYFNGIHELCEYSMMTPFYLTFGYKAHIKDFFMISPEVGFGGAYIMNQNDPDMAVLYGADEQESSFEPVFFVGVQFNFLVLQGLAINIGVDYSAIIEGSGLMDFMTMYAEIGYRF